MISSKEGDGITFSFRESSNRKPESEHGLLALTPKDIVSLKSVSQVGGCVVEVRALSLPNASSSTGDEIVPTIARSLISDIWVVLPLYLAFLSNFRIENEPFPRPVGKS